MNETSTETSLLVGKTLEQMRKILILAATALMFACCIGGRSTEQGPGETVQEFYMALAGGEYALAESFCDTLHMKGYIEAIRQVREQNDSTVDAIVSGILSTIEVNITDIRKEGEGRTVFYELKSDGVRTKKKVATLAQEEGAWRIREITDRH